MKRNLNFVQSLASSLKRKDILRRLVDKQSDIVYKMPSVIREMKRISEGIGKENATFQGEHHKVEVVRFYSGNN